MAFLIPGTVKFDRRAIARAIWADVNAKKWYWLGRPEERLRLFSLACKRVWTEARIERGAVLNDGLAPTYTPAEQAKLNELNERAACAAINAGGNADFRRFRDAALAIHAKAARRAVRARLAELTR